MVADTRRAMAITTALNRLGFDDLDEIRRLFAGLVGGSPARLIRSIAGE